MAKYSTYKSLSTVKARKVGKDGEQVVTSEGVQQVSAGDYVILDDNAGAPALRVMNAETFESTYGRQSRSKPTATSSDAPPTVQGVTEDSGQAPSPSSAESAKARVKAAQVARAAKK